MKTQKYLAEVSTKLMAFFSSITGMVMVMSMIILIDSLMNGFAVGKIFGVRMGEYAESNIHWWSFAFGSIITLCLSISIVVSSITHRIDVSELEGAAKQIAKDKNKDLTKLSQTLCNFSIVISLMSVGIFMFDGVSYEQLVLMTKTPIFYCQILMFLCIAIGVPKSIVRFSTFMYIKHHDIIDKLNTNTGKSIHKMIDNQFKEDDSDNNEEEESNIIKLVNKIRETGT